jgi:ribosomal protein S18 acetylase RimI-like enzyme
MDSELALRAIRKLKEAEPHSSLNIEYFQKFLSRAENILISTTDGDLPVGFLVAYLLDRVDRDQRMVCLYEIGVLESYRQRGVATGMIEALKAICNEENIMKTWVITDRSNHAAVRLYEKTGATANPDAQDVVYVYALNH